MKLVNIKQIIIWVIPFKVFIFRSREPKINVLVFFTCKKMLTKIKKNLGRQLLHLLVQLLKLTYQNFRPYIMQICNFLEKIALGFVSVMSGEIQSGH